MKNRYATMYGVKTPFTGPKLTIGHIGPKFPRSSLHGPSQITAQPDILRAPVRNPAHNWIALKGLVIRNQAAADSKVVAPSTSKPVINAVRNVRGPIVGSVTPLQSIRNMIYRVK